MGRVSQGRGKDEMILARFKWYRRAIGGRWAKASCGWVRVGPECLEFYEEHWANCAQLEHAAHDALRHIGANGLIEVKPPIERLQRSLIYLSSDNVWLTKDNEFRP